MKIEEACENKGTLPDLMDMYCLIVRHGTGTVSPCWYDAKTDHFRRHVSGIEAMRTDWQVFQEAKQIRPENEREAWINESVVALTSFNENGDLKFINCNGTSYRILDNVIHNKNGWIRISPKVEDDSVERIEIEAYLQDATIMRSSLYSEGKIMFSVSESDWDKLGGLHHNFFKITLDLTKHP